MPSLETVIILLHSYGYLFLFAIAVLEGPVITVVGAFLATQGFFNIYLVYAVVVAGDLAGDLLYYSAGRTGRIGMLERISLRVGLTADRYEQLEEYFKRHGPKAMFYAKYTQTGLIALPAAGAARMPVGKFLWYNTLGTLPKSLGFVLLGYFFGYAYNQINTYVARISLIVFVCACIAGFYIFVRKNQERAP